MLAKTRSSVINTFSFGDNWQAYAHTVDNDRIDQAAHSLARLLPALEWNNRHMLDAGCGSAIHSLAGVRLGAATVCAFDRDPVAVATARSLVARYAPSACISITEACLLDQPFSDQHFDIVLCWGVAHHTGALWPTLAYLSQRLSREGILILAVYKKTPFCRFWRWEKHVFCRLPRLGRSLVVALYLTLLLSAVALTGRNPIAYIRSYRCRRGMSLWHDAIDWLGGIPYESAKPEDVIHFMNDRGLALLSLHHDKPMIGLAGSGCAEFVFRAHSDTSVREREVAGNSTP